MKLIKNYKKSHKMFSQQAFVLQGSLQAFWLTLTPEQIQLLPDNLVNFVTLQIVIAGFVGRIVDQGIDQETEE